MYRKLYKGIKYFSDGKLWRADILETTDDNLLKTLSFYAKGMNIKLDETVDCANQGDGHIILPKFTGVIGQLNKPHFIYNHTAEYLMTLAREGGYGNVIFTDGNDLQSPDSVEYIRKMQQENSAYGIDSYIIGNITKGCNGLKPVGFEQLNPYVVGYSDKDFDVADEALMKDAMFQIAPTGKPIMSSNLLPCDSLDEYSENEKYRCRLKVIEKNIRLAALTGCHYHVTNVEGKQMLDMIRDAKASGVRVTCDVSPELLIPDKSGFGSLCRTFTNQHIQDVRFALLDGIIDGTIDAIVVRDYKTPLTIKLSYPLLYTSLVSTGKISEERLAQLMITNPGVIFGINEEAKFGNLNGFNILDLSPSSMIYDGSIYHKQLVYGLKKPIV